MCKWPFHKCSSWVWNKILKGVNYRACTYLQFLIKVKCLYDKGSGLHGAKSCILGLSWYLNWRFKMPTFITCKTLLFSVPQLLLDFRWIFSHVSCIFILLYLWLDFIFYIMWECSFIYILVQSHQIYEILKLRWEVNVHFVDIGGIDDHRCLKFLFIKIRWIDFKFWSIWTY